MNREMGLYVFSPPTEVGCQVSAVYVKTFDFFRVALSRLRLGLELWSLAKRGQWKE